MDEQEIEYFEKLKQELSTKHVSKQTAIDCKRTYNRYNEKKIKYCMCNGGERRRWAGIMLEWYEARD